MKAFSKDERSDDFPDVWPLLCVVPPVLSIDPPFPAASHVEQEEVPSPAEPPFEELEDVGIEAAVVEEAPEPSPQGRDSTTGARMASR